MRVRRKHCLLVRLVISLAVVVLLVGLIMVAPVFAEDVFEEAVFGLDDVGEVFSELVEPLLAEPVPAAPPEFLEEALARASRAAQTPLKALTSAVLDFAVPWVFEHGWLIAVLAAAAGVSAALFVLIDSSDGEDFVPDR